MIESTGAIEWKTGKTSVVNEPFKYDIDSLLYIENKRRPMKKQVVEDPQNTRRQFKFIQIMPLLSLCCRPDRVMYLR